MTLYTTLHRILDLPPGGLRAEHLERVVEEGVGESSDLDWKVSLPDSRDSASKEEFAKDVTAMANSGGGLIVFGVAETDSRATELLGVEIPNGLREQLHAVIGSHVRPVLIGVQIEIIHLQADRSAVLVAVPDSAELPHGIELQRDSPRFPRFPYRNGPTTDYMSEGMLSRAYLRRHDRSAEAARRVSEELDARRAMIQRPQATWLSLAAAASTAGSGRSEAVMAPRVINDAAALSGVSNMNHLLGSRARNPRPGYRRLVVSEALSIATPSTSDRIDLMWNGDSAMHFWLNPDHLVPEIAAFRVGQLRSFIAMSTALAVTHAALAGSSGLLTIGVELLPANDTDVHAVELWEMRSIGGGGQHLGRVPDSITVSDPVTAHAFGDLHAIAGDIAGAFGDIVHELLSDIVGHFGVGEPPRE